MADPTPDLVRDAGGRLVREVWVEWAREQPNPKPTWLVGWDDLPEPDREVDRRIAERVGAAARADERERLLAAVEVVLTEWDTRVDRTPDRVLEFWLRRVRAALDAHYPPVSRAERPGGRY